MSKNRSHTSETAAAKAAAARKANAAKIVLEVAAAFGAGFASAPGASTPPPPVFDSAATCHWFTRQLIAETARKLKRKEFTYARWQKNHPAVGRLNVLRAATAHGRAAAQHASVGLGQSVTKKAVLDTFTDPAVHTICPPGKGGGMVCPAKLKA